MPVHKGLKPVLGFTTEIPTIRAQRLIDSTEKSLRNLTAKRLFTTDRIGAPGSTSNIPAPTYSSLRKASRKKVDTEIHSQIAEYKDQRHFEAETILNEGTSRFQPLISGGLSNIMNNGRSSSIGSITLGLQYRITNFKQRSGNKIDPHYIYAAWNTSTAKSNDTASFIKTVTFPELAKSDFILGYHNDIIEGNFVRGCLAEISFTTYRDTANTHLFRSESLLLGYQVSFLGNLPNLIVPAGFKALLYGNIINVDPKYNSGYNSLTAESDIHNTFFNLGLRVQADVNGATLFFNGKYILNPHKNITNPDLIRFVYTIGTLVSL